jgi:hypothetical protein
LKTPFRIYRGKQNIVATPDAVAGIRSKAGRKETIHALENFADFTDLQAIMAYDPLKVNTASRPKSTLNRPLSALPTASKDSFDHAETSNPFIKICCRTHDVKARVGDKTFAEIP